MDKSVINTQPQPAAVGAEIKQRFGPRALLLTHTDGRETIHPISEYVVAYRDTAVSEALLYEQAAIVDAVDQANARQNAAWRLMCEKMVAAEREQSADALRCALEALDYCIEDSAELLNERTVQWGSYCKDRQAAMAATLERHRAVAERLRAMLRA